MKIKHVKLEWNVLRYDINKHEIVNSNAFYSDTPQKIAKEIRKGIIKNKQDLKNWLNVEFLYHYWCKSEHEVLIGGLFDETENMEKIDVYRQLNMNLDRITDYVIQEMDIKF